MLETEPVPFALTQPVGRGLADEDGEMLRRISAFLHVHGTLHISPVF